MTDNELVERLRSLKRWFRRPRVKVAFPQTVRPVATEAEVADAERRLGKDFPELLRRIFLEVGNGGFGPGYGLLGVGSGMKTPLGDDLVGTYKRLSYANGPYWPKDHVPVIDWGGGSFSLIDFSSGRINRFVPDIHGVGDPSGNELLEEADTLKDYLRLWLEGADLSRPKSLSRLRPREIDEAE